MKGPDADFQLAQAAESFNTARHLVQNGADIKFNTDRNGIVHYSVRNSSQTVDAGSHNKSNITDTAVSSAFGINHNSSDAAIIATGVVGTVAKTALHAVTSKIPKLQVGTSTKTTGNDIAISNVRKSFKKKSSYVNQDPVRMIEHKTGKNFKF